MTGKELYKIVGLFVFTMFVFGLANVNAGVCKPGQMQYDACDGCSNKERKCSSDGAEWGTWSACGGKAVEPPVKPPAAKDCTTSKPSGEKRSCGSKCGVQVKLYTCDPDRNTWIYEGWGRCLEEMSACSPGETAGCFNEKNSRGTKTCKSDCSWGACSGDAPGYDINPPSGGGGGFTGPGGGTGGSTGGSSGGGSSIFPPSGGGSTGGSSGGGGSIFPPSGGGSTGGSSGGGGFGGTTGGRPGW